jgi:hypothetical protein
MVIGNKHIFYDVSNSNFSITNPSSSFALAFSGIENGQNKDACQGTNVAFDLNYSTLAGFSGLTNLSISGNPIGTTATFSPSSISSTGVINLTIGNTQAATSGFYEMTVTATSGANSKIVKLYLNILNSAFAPMVLVSPNNLAFAQPTSLDLTWSADIAATAYILEVATDEDFTNIITTQTLTTTSNTISGLNELSNYFWRVQARNTGCFGMISTPYRFTIGQKACTTFTSTNIPITISGSGTPTINSTISIPVGSNVIISDLNVTAQITHSWISDLTLTLISPLGTQIQLVSGQCADSNNMNATFDDSGSNLICGSPIAINGIIKPTNRPADVCASSAAKFLPECISNR